MKRSGVQGPVGREGEKGVVWIYWTVLFPPLFKQLGLALGNILGEEVGEIQILQLQLLIHSQSGFVWLAIASLVKVKGTD